MKAYTDIEQSKKLVEILSTDSADHHYVRKTCDFMGNPVDGKWSEPKYGNPNSKYAHYMVQNFTNYETLPCWSLTALLDLMPERIKIGEELSFCLTLKKSSTGFGFGYNLNGSTFVKNNPIDAAFEMVCWLKENGKI